MNYTIKNLKFRTLAIAWMILAASPFSIAQTAVWNNIERIVGNIDKTHFPNLWVSVLDFGAVADSPDKPAGDAINRAILYVSTHGGGRVIIPEGTFYTGPITLKSNVNLQLSDDTVLKFLTDPQMYFPAVLTRWEGIDCYNTRPLIYAYGETNIAITGNGTIDAQGAPDTWWGRLGIERGLPPEDLMRQDSTIIKESAISMVQADLTLPDTTLQSSMTKEVMQAASTARAGSRAKLQEWNASSAPSYRRIFSAEDGMRPQMINLLNCKAILIEGVTLLNSPFWTIHPLFCEDMIIRDVTIINNAPNGDGCNPESCKNVLIENCTFDTGDDCIAIKSGRNEDGRRWNIPSENIVIRKCHMKNGHGGVVIGSEISGGFRNLYVENCKMDSPELDRVIRIKSSTARGGTIENIYIRNIEVGQCREAVLKINLDYDPDEQARRGFTPTVRNIYLDNVKCSKSEYGIWLYGLDNPLSINNVHINNCTFNGVVSEGNYIYGTFSDIFFHNSTINESPAML